MASPLRKQHNNTTSKRIKYFIIPYTVINNIKISTTSTQQVYNNVHLICYNVSEEMHEVRQHCNVLKQLQHISGLIGQSGTV
jgi:hypothetical protein